MDITPENLYTVLLALREAGVARAKFGPAPEFEFWDERPPIVPVQQQPIVAAQPVVRQFTPGVTQPGQSEAEPEIKHPGYAQLFGSGAPRFTPVEG